MTKKEKTVYLTKLAYPLVLAAALAMAVYHLDPIKLEEGIWVTLKAFAGGIVGMIIALPVAALRVARSVSDDTFYKVRGAIVCATILAICLGF